MGLFFFLMYELVKPFIILTLKKKKTKAIFSTISNRINDQVQKHSGSLVVNPKTTSKTIYKEKPGKMPALIL